MGTPGARNSGDTLSKRVGAENLCISESQVKLVFGKIDPKVRARHINLRRKVASNMVIEGAERDEALLDLSSKLGIEEPDKEVFSEDEKEALRISIKSYREDKDNTVEYGEMCQGFMRSLRTRTLFKAKFKEWDSTFKRDYPEIAENENYRNSDEFKLYIQERGVEFINANKELINEDTVLAFEENNKEVSEAEQNEVDTLPDAVNGFIDMYGEQMLSNDKDVKDATYGKFKELMVEQGYGDIEEVKIKALYEKLVYTEGFAYLSIKEYRDLSEKMIQNVDVEGMTDERWEEMLDLTTANKYHPEEAISEGFIAQSYGSGGGIITSDGMYSSFDQLGSVRGVVIRQDPANPDLYIVDSHKIQDKSNLPRVRIVNSDLFEMEFQFPDNNGEYDGENIRGNPSKKYKYSNLLEAINTQLLDYNLNKRSKENGSEKQADNPNKVVDGESMKRLAVSLFGFGLNERQLGDDHLVRFGRLTTILTREEQVSTKRMVNFLSDKNNANLVWQILSTGGSVSYTVESLINLAEDVRKGDRDINGGIKI